MALMAALIDIVGMLIAFLLYSLFGAKGALLSWPWNSKMLDPILDGLFWLFFFPAMVLNPLLWALGGVLFYYVRRSIRNGGLYIAR